MNHIYYLLKLNISDKINSSVIFINVENKMIKISVLYKRLNTAALIVNEINKLVSANHNYFGIVSYTNDTRGVIKQLHHPIKIFKYNQYNKWRNLFIIAYKMYILQICKIKFNDDLRVVIYTPEALSDLKNHFPKQLKHLNFNNDIYLLVLINKLIRTKTFDAFINVYLEEQELIEI